VYSGQLMTERQHSHVYDWPVQHFQQTGSWPIDKITGLEFKEVTGPYSLSGPGGQVIDASLIRGVLAYINDAREPNKPRSVNEAKYNTYHRQARQLPARFVTFPPVKHGNMHTQVKKNSELFVSYGKTGPGSYWDGLTESKLLFATFEVYSQEEFDERWQEFLCDTKERYYRVGTSMPTDLRKTKKKTQTKKK